MSSFEQGQALFAAGNYNEAVTAFRQAQKAGTEPADELFAALGHAYYRLGDLTTAVFNYSQALLNNPNEAYHLRFRGIVYLEQRQQTQEKTKKASEERYTIRCSEKKKEEKNK